MGSRSIVKLRMRRHRTNRRSRYLRVPMHWAPEGVPTLTDLDDDTRCWRNTTTASIGSHQQMYAPPHEEEDLCQQHFKFCTVTQF